MFISGNFNTLPIKNSGIINLVHRKSTIIIADPISIK